MQKKPAISTSSSASANPPSAPLAVALNSGRGKDNEATRKHNLSTMLGLLHHQQRLTRAQLTRLTGLNRSTVGGLVSQLVELNLAHELPPANPAGKGRPSPVVVPNDQICVIAANPDSDATVVGLIGLGGKVWDVQRIPSPSALTPAYVAAAISEYFHRQIRKPGYRVIGIGIAVPGLVRTADGLVKTAINLGWEDAPLAELVGAQTGAPAFVGNDANLGVIAEALYGAGREATDFIYLDGLASGVGGGVVVGGTPLVGAKGYGGELGHTLLRSDGPQCRCGRYGCLETEISFHRLAQQLSPSPTSIAELDGLLRQSSSPKVSAEVRRQAIALGTALANLVTIFNPEMVVLGGFLSSILAAEGNAVLMTMRDSAFQTMGEEVEVIAAAVRDHTVLLGAAELAFQPLLHRVDLNLPRV